MLHSGPERYTCIEASFQKKQGARRLVRSVSLLWRSQYNTYSIKNGLTWKTIPTGRSQLRRNAVYRSRPANTAVVD
jgi:hypothetical protein